MAQSKTEKPKTARIDPRAYAILDRYKGGTYVFKVRGDVPLSANYCNVCCRANNWHLRKIGEQLGLPNCLTTHTARHSFAEWGVTNKIAVNTLMQMMGVTSFAAFQHYIASFNKDEVEKAADLFTKASGGGG